MIYTLGILECYRCQKEIVYDHQILVCCFPDVFLQSIASLCLTAFIQVICHGDVFRRVLHLTCVPAQRTRHICLSAAGGSKDERIPAAGDVQARSKTVQC